jgi:isopropylmalate/homocitrate/citramalate synthase
LATACTIASLKAGAFCAQLTVNGLGEKTGNADLFETIFACMLYGIESKIDLMKMHKLSSLLENISGIKNSPLRPIVGENVFIRESGVTAAQLITYPPAVEGYSPELIGRKRNIVLSKKSGKKSIEYKLSNMGISVEDGILIEILNEVKTTGIKNKGLVTDEEFITIVNKIVNI